MADDANLTLPIQAEDRSQEAQMNSAVNALNRSMDKMEARTGAFEKKLNNFGGGSRIGEAVTKVFDSSRLAVLEEGSAKLRVFGSALEPLGAAGIAAAAGVAAFAIAAERAMKSAEWAESLQKASDRLDVSTTALQGFDFAMASMGIGVEKGRESLDGLNVAVGKVEDNLLKGKSGPQLRLFESILGTDSKGATQEALRNLGDVTNVMAKIQTYVQPMSASQRGAVAAVLKIDPDVLTALGSANDKIGDLVATARSFGVIADEDLIKKSAEAAEKLHTVAAVVDDEVKVAFAGLATPLANAELGFLRIAQRIGDVIRGADDSLGPIQAMLDKLAQIPGAGAATKAATAPGIGTEFLARLIPGDNGLIGPLIAPIITYFKALGAKGAQDRDVDQLIAGASGRERSLKGTGYKGVGDGGGGRARRAPADHSATEIGEAEQRYLEALIRGEKGLQAHTDRLKLIDVQFQTAAARAKTEKNPATAATLLNTAGLTRDADIRDEGQRYAAEMTAELVKALDGEVDAHKRTRESADRADEAQLQLLEAQGGLLQAQQGLATTTAERKRIAGQLLANDQARAAVEITKRARDDGADPAAALAALNATGAAKGAGLDREFEGPLAKFSDDAKSTTAGEQLQTTAVQAIDTLNAGLKDTILEGGKFGDVLKKALKDAEGDLLQWGLKKLEGAALGGGGADAFAWLGGLFKGAGGGAASAGASGGNVVGTILGALGGFAGGTGAGGAPGGPAIVGEHGPEVLNLSRGASVTSNSSLRAMLNASPLRAGGGQAVNIATTVNYDLRGNSSTAEVQAMLAASEARTKVQVSDSVRRSMPGWQAQYQVERG